MAALTDFMENKLIDFLFRSQALTAINGTTAGAGSGPTTLYIGLFTVAPTDVGGGTEVSGSNYARASVASGLTAWKSTQNDSTASTGTTGTTSNTAAVTFNVPSASWGTVVAFGIFDAASAGNLLIYSALTISKTINSGDTVSFPIGSLTVQLDN